jgi:phosphotransferase system enzyme I (PtsP)
MLETLRRIVEAVNTAPDLETALQMIVQRVKRAINADVCSVYLTDFETREHVLQATDGLRPEAIGKVRLAFHRGLIGLVCEREEPVNLADAPAHPRYVFAHETGEKRYHGFLGVPIIQNRRVLGVLVVRQLQPRSFDENEVTFVLTLAAQLAGAITHARASGELDSLREATGAAPSRFLEGRPGSSGVALGRAVVVYPPADLEAIPDRLPDDPAREETAFRAAVARVIAELTDLKKRIADHLPAEDRALFDALLLMLDSDSLVARTVERIQAGNWAPGALRETIEAHAKIFEGMEDVYLRERVSDVRDLGRRILMYLQSNGDRVLEYSPGSILVGEDVSAVQLAEVPREALAGVVSARGSSSSHVAILARAMGLPAVMGVIDLPAARMHGREIIIDGYRGRVYLSPAQSVRAEYQRWAEEDRALSAELEEQRHLPSETTDGVAVALHLNTGLVVESSSLESEEAAGVGLYRTELPFMVRDRFPGEEVQELNYRRVLETFAPRPVNMRTLDIGGDKPLPYFPVEESNPFLGWRGIRISLDHPEIFLTQVRAMLRADVDLHNLRLLLPMISTPAEVEDALRLIQRAHDELVEEGYRVRMPPVGVMVEVPAAVYQVESLARRVDFLSVGTNDLTQYFLAVDRNNAHVAGLYDDMHPAVLRAVQQAVEGAARYQREVSVCGEMAGNPAAVVLLLGMGISNLSMSAGSLLRIKRVVRSFSRARARELLKTALRFEEAEAVHRLMNRTLEEMGLGGLMRPGR